MVRQEFSVEGQHQSVLPTSSGRVSTGVGRRTAPRFCSPESGKETRPTQRPRMNTTRQKVVWIANEGGHSYKQAEKFGRLIPLTKGSVNYFNLDRLMVTIGPKLQSVHPDDYMLVSGTPVIVGLVIAMWLARFDHINILQWSQSRGTYIEIVLHREAVEKNSLDGRIAS